MLIFENRNQIEEFLDSERTKNKKIGFIPTMGFLHGGHASLILRSKKENNLTVCSIFVNPLQFDQKEDYYNYPRNINKDIEYLKYLKCDVLFLPSYESIYPPDHKIMSYHFGHLESVMEGIFRSEHFQGVAEVVRILFSIIKPHFAYFGEKDYQQLLIIKELIRQLKLPITIIPCPTIREADGLAMSSRNSLLKEEQRKNASFIYQQLLFAKQNYSKYTPHHLKNIIIENFRKNPIFKLDYFEFADAFNLQPVEKWENHKCVRAFTAARINSVRLIDNIEIFNIRD